MKKPRILQFSLWSILIIFFLILCIKEAEAKTITVDDDDGGQDYVNIQDAIDNATDGDTIRVYEGIYYENLVVNKTVNLIGNGTEYTTIDGEGNGNVVEINTNNVEISKFFITRSRIYWHEKNAGIKIDSSNNLISNCNISNFHLGISLTFSKNNTISSCNISNNGYMGIEIKVSENNTISSCNISNNGHVGIDIFVSNNNIISNTNISNNEEGIRVHPSSNNIISYCNISNNKGNGIQLDSFSNYNTITNCNISNNIWTGIKLDDSSNNSISNCNILNNNHGIYIRDDSYDNTIFHNNFINNNNSASDECSNQWDNAEEGNYWDDYVGNDRRGDGIGDTPFNITGGNNKDRYPLIEPYKEETNPTTNIINKDKNVLPNFVFLLLIIVIIFILLILFIDYWYQTKN